MSKISIPIDKKLISNLYGNYSGFKEIVSYDIKSQPIEYRNIPKITTQNDDGDVTGFIEYSIKFQAESPTNTPVLLIPIEVQTIVNGEFHWENHSYCISSKPFNLKIETVPEFEYTRSWSSNTNSYGGPSQTTYTITKKKSSKYELTPVYQAASGEGHSGFVIVNQVNQSNNLSKTIKTYSAKQLKDTGANSDSTILRSIKTKLPNSLSSQFENLYFINYNILSSLNNLTLMYSQLQYSYNTRSLVTEDGEAIYEQSSSGGSYQVSSSDRYASASFTDDKNYNVDANVLKNIGWNYSHSGDLSFLTKWPINYADINKIGIYRTYLQETGYSAISDEASIILLASMNSKEVCNYEGDSYITIGFYDKTAGKYIETSKAGIVDNKILNLTSSNITTYSFKSEIC